MGDEERHVAMKRPTETDEERRARLAAERLRRGAARSSKTRRELLRPRSFDEVRKNLRDVTTQVRRYAKRNDRRDIAIIAGVLYRMFGAMTPFHRRRSEFVRHMRDYGKSLSTDDFKWEWPADPSEPADPAEPPEEESSPPPPPPRVNVAVIPLERLEALEQSVAAIRQALERGPAAAQTAPESAVVAALPPPPETQRSPRRASRKRGE